MFSHQEHLRNTQRTWIWKQDLHQLHFRIYSYGIYSPNVDFNSYILVSWKPNLVSPRLCLESDYICKWKISFLACRIIFGLEFSIWQNGLTISIINDLENSFKVKDSTHSCSYFTIWHLVSKKWSNTRLNILEKVLKDFKRVFDHFVDSRHYRVKIIEKKV